MKRKRIVLAAVLLAFFAATAQAGALKLRVMSFNIRCLNGDDAPENQWRERVSRVMSYVLKTNPDLLGMQEVTPQQLADVKAHTSAYGCLSAGRDNGSNAGESTPILYRKDKFRLIKSGHFWLSETPEEPSFGWNAACRRIAQWAVLENIKSGKRFIYCNTHFDHISLEARKQSAKLLKDRLREIAPDMPFILSADFNTNEKEETYPLLLNHSYTCVDTWKAVKKAKGGPATWNSWGKAKNTPDNKIDFIFTSENVKIKRAVIASPTDKEDRFLSDHNAIWTDIKIK